MKLPFTIFQCPQDPILIVRNHAWDRFRQRNFFISAFTAFISSWLLVQGIQEGESKIILYFLVGGSIAVSLVAAWVYWNKYIAFDRAEILIGYTIRRELFVRPRTMLYAEIRHVLFTHHVFMSAIHFGPSIFRPTNIMLARGFSEDGLKPVLLLLKERAGLWTFDDKAKKLLEKFEAEELRPKRLDE